MAFRKRTASKGKPRAGGYSKGAGGSGYRKPARQSGRASGGKAAGVHTVRIVIEQPGTSRGARPDGAAVTADIKARKSPF